MLEMFIMGIFVTPPCYNRISPNTYYQSKFVQKGGAAHVLNYHGWHLGSLILYVHTAFEKPDLIAKYHTTLPCPVGHNPAKIETDCFPRNSCVDNI